MHRLAFLAILVLYLVVGALYATLTPPWQAPDEPAHFNYIRTIGDTGTLPILQPGDYDQQYLENIKAAKFPATMPVDAIRYESYQPPLYYLAATPVYLAARMGGLDAQVIALRLLSTFLGAIVLLLAYAVVREIFPADRVLALATTALIATIPMQAAVTASVSNDSAAEVVVAAILLLAVKRCKHTVSDRRYILLGGILFGAALLTKTTAYVTGGTLLLLAEIANRWPQSLRRIPLTLIPLYLISFLMAAPMFIRNMLTYGWADPLGLARHDSIVVGQPTTAEMIGQYGLNRIVADFFVVTFKSFWAQFGWMGVLVHDRIYWALLALTVLALAGFLVYAVRLLRQRARVTRTQWWCAACLALLLMTGVADYIGYNFKFLQFQGRYLFPALIPIALVLVLGLRRWSLRRYASLTFAVLYVALVGLDIACLFLYIVPQLRT